MSITAKEVHRTNWTEIAATPNTVIGDRPFFPIGIYHVSWEETATAQMRLNHLHEMAAAGFNTVYVSAPWSKNYREFDRFVNEAEKLSVSVIGENFVSMLDFINAFKHKPPIFSWSIADDVGDPERGPTPEKLVNQYRQVKGADPDRNTYLSITSIHKPDSLKVIVGNSDIVAQQVYPIRLGNKQELSSTFVELNEIGDRVAQAGNIFYANLQAFPWSAVNPKDEIGTRSPTAEEARNMTYQSLLAGVKGIIYYTYHDEVWHLPDHPELWMGIKSLVPELKAISQFVMTGQFNNFQSEDKSLLAGMWKLPDRTAIVLVNTSYEQPLEIAMSVPDSVKQLQPMFDDRPASITLQGDRLTGSLAPLEVQVYIAGISSK